MDFTPINTQEEFDAAVAERYGDVGNLQQQITTLTGERDANAQTVTELRAQIKGYETAALKQRVAREKGIPAEMADRLSGETEKDLRADAEAIAGILKAIKGPAPLANPEPHEPDSKTAALTNMLHDLKGE